MNISEHENQWLAKNGAKMVSALGVAPGHSVIEFGCGKGRYVIPISQVVGEHGSVLAIERDGAEIVELRERINMYPGSGPISILDTKDIGLASVADRTIDNMFVFDVLQYIANWELFFQSAQRVLKTNGCVHVYPAAVPHPGDVDMAHLESVLRAVGFQAGDAKEFFMMHNKHMVTDVVHTYCL